MATAEGVHGQAAEKAPGAAVVAAVELGIQSVTSQALVAAEEAHGQQVAVQQEFVVVQTVLVAAHAAARSLVGLAGVVVGKDIARVLADSTVVGVADLAVEGTVQCLEAVSDVEG